MKISKTIYAIIILILLCRPLFAQRADYFPLEKGTTWIYKGTVTWTESVKKIKKRKISWKMTVTKRLKNGQFEVAVMEGHPADLCWYESGKKPSRYLIVWKDDKYYEIRIKDDFDKLVDDEVYLFAKANHDSLFLVDPLKKNLRFGNDPDVPRDDTFYEWLVEDEQSGSLSGVGGVPHRQKVERYTLIYRTMPDHQIVEFVPFVGITKYFYQHHGTVAEVDVRLTEFRQK